ncbi:HPr kinase/phosphorylase [Ammoniphilus oxalaticus]|uniref:HPr kinase/phosphorylase n=1 Tax=Ammoniphilus oxalaticus TaxID=66863 RepID=A0A419SEY0_9BACL|nr:HPr(Ser) kinase/phosphatase [Ammoniphilus oxalaticus]RKD21817.1 HPr kinase/phosphorylase [Ammoniphilus oxalaticus]
MKRTIVKDISQHLEFDVVSGNQGITREIKTSNIHRPALELAGHINLSKLDRVQLLGDSEVSFVKGLDPALRLERFQQLCAEHTPCVCISRELEIPTELIQASNEFGVPVLYSNLSTTKLFSKVATFLEGRLAPVTTIHGVLVDVYGIGVLLMGGSGIGKSETALELVKRGHRLIADDAVEIRQTQENQLIGNAPELIQHLLEIRGLGIINVMTLFGAGAVRNFKRISLVIKMELWDQERHYERLGIDEETMKIMDTELPQITIPVRPGRNMAVICEVAAMNFRLKRMGYNAAVHFSRRLTDTIEEASEEM